MTPRRHYSVPLPHGRRLVLGERTLVMGILNVTPDSFSDGGALQGVGPAVDAAMRMVDDGADIIDVGGESTRPGATAVPEGEELRRVIPVVEALAARLQVPISIDTYKAAVADAASQAGAAIVNDISGLRYDPRLAEVVASRRLPIILMHMRGRSEDMYQQATYHDVVDEVRDELGASVAFAVRAGLSAEAVLVDPGPRLREGRQAQLRGAGPLRGVRRPGPPHRDRTLAQVVPRRAHSPRVARSRRRVADGRRCNRRGPGWSAHRARARRARDGAGGAGGRRDSEVSSRPMREWLQTALQRPPIDWWDLLDVAIVAVFFYQLLLLIRGTRAVQMAVGGGLRDGAVLPVAVAGARDRQLADSQRRRLRGVRRHRAVSGRHPPRARALRPRAVPALLQPPARRGGRGRGAGGRGRRTCPSHRIGALIVIERQIGLRNYIEGGIPLDAVDHLRSAGQHLPDHLAAARRRGDRPGRPHRGRRLLPAALGQPEGQPSAGHAAPRRARPDRRERRAGRRGVRGNRASSRWRSMAGWSAT